jgi:hypothetical protein
MADPSVKVTTYLSRRLHERVKREAGDRRISVRAVMEAALAERYDPEHARAEELLVLKELRALRNDVRRVDFGNRVLTELTTLTTKNLFQRLPSPTDESRAAGTGFYNALIASVEKIFSQNTPLLDKFAASLMTASEAEFDALAEATDKAQEHTDE